MKSTHNNMWDIPTKCIQLCLNTKYHRETNRLLSFEFDALATQIVYALYSSYSS